MFGECRVPNQYYSLLKEGFGGVTSQPIAVPHHVGDMVEDLRDFLDWVTNFSDLRANGHQHITPEVLPEQPPTENDGKRINQVGQNDLESVLANALDAEGVKDAENKEALKVLAGESSSDPASASVEQTKSEGIGASTEGEKAKTCVTQTPTQVGPADNMDHESKPVHGQHEGMGTTVSEPEVDGKDKIESQPNQVAVPEKGMTDNDNVAKVEDIIDPEIKPAHDQHKGMGAKDNNNDKSAEEVETAAPASELPEPPSPSPSVPKATPVTPVPVPKKTPRSKAAASPKAPAKVKAPKEDKKASKKNEDKTEKTGKKKKASVCCSNSE